MLNFLFKNNTVKQTIAKNTFWLFLGQIVSKILRFILVAYSARTLGASEFGSFSFAFSLVTLTFVLADLGLSSLTVREYQQPSPHRHLISTSFWLRTALSIGSMLVSFAVYPFVEDPIARHIFPLIVLLYMLTNIRDFFTSLYRAEQRMEREGILWIIESIVLLGAGYWMLHTVPSALHLLYAHFISVFAFFVCAYALLKKPSERTHISSRQIFGPMDPELARHLVGLSWPTALSAILFSILVSMDATMLGFLKSADVVGQYSVAARLAYVLLTVPGVIGTAFFPLMSQLKDDKQRLHGVVKKGTNAILIISLPLMFGGFLLGDRMITTFFGEGYLPAIAVFQILSIMYLYLFPIVFWDIFLLSVNLQLKDFQYTSIATALNVVLNFLLIPKFSLYGAALATASSQFINFFLTHSLVRRYFGKTVLDWSAILRYMIASGVMCAVIALFIPFYTTSYIVIPTAISAYVVMLYILKDPLFLSFLSAMKRKSREFIE